MNFDGSKRVEGAGAGVVLISPEGDKLKYVLRMTFPNASNNEAEYEALIHGMNVTAQGNTHIRIACSFSFMHHGIMHHHIHVFFVLINKNYFINPKLFSFSSHMVSILNLLYYSFNKTLKHIFKVL
jgi:hypothetical protein